MTATRNETAVAGGIGAMSTMTAVSVKFRQLILARGLQGNGSSGHFFLGLLLQEQFPVEVSLRRPFGSGHIRCLENLRRHFLIALFDNGIFKPA